MKSSEYEVVWPLGRSTVEVKPLAPRLSDLKGKTIGELWDGVFRGNEIFPMLEEMISKQYPGVNFVSWSEFPRDGDHGFPDWESHPGLLAEKGCDAIITAMGA